MRILVTGATGQIGSTLVSSLKKNGDDVFGTSKSSFGANIIELNLANISLIKKQLSQLKTLDSLVLCAGVTSIKDCQLDPINSRVVNVDAQVEVAMAALEMGCTRIVFVSTDKIFDGNKSFIRSDTIANPTTEYGKQKLHAEIELSKLGAAVQIIRFTKVLSEQNQLLVDWISQLQRGEAITAFVDSVISPVSVESAVEVISALIAGSGNAINQFSASDEISFYEMGCALAEIIESPVSNVLQRKASDVGETAIAHSSLESTLFSSIKPMSSLHAVRQIVEKIISS